MNFKPKTKVFLANSYKKSGPAVLLDPTFKPNIKILANSYPKPSLFMSLKSNTKTFLAKPKHFMGFKLSPIGTYNLKIFNKLKKNFKFL